MEKDAIINKVRSNLSGTELEIVILYGSRILRHDIDILAILRSSSKYENVKDPPLDIIVIGMPQFRMLIPVLDPLATEPLLTGSPLLGNIAPFYAMLRSTESTMSATKHIITCSVLFLKWAHDNLAANRPAKCCNSCAFAAAYAAFAQFYCKTSSTTTLYNLLSLPENSQVVDILWEAKQISTCSFEALDLLKRSIGFVQDTRRSMGQPFADYLTISNKIRNIYG